MSEIPLLKSALHSLDRCESTHGTLARPDRYRTLRELLKHAPQIIARGAGLSYCLASAGDGTTSIAMGRFNRILEFDRETGVIRVEAGMALGNLLEFVARHGFWLPVLPGYPSITVGGAIAMNIHGKSAYHSGLFADHVATLWLEHPDHGEIRCSKLERADVFDLTIGGFGFTGVIVSARIILKKPSGNRIERTRIKTANLADTVAVFDKHKEKSDQIYSWNDLNRSSRRFGAGFAYLESFIKVPARGGFEPLAPASLESERVSCSLVRRPLLDLIPHVYRALEARRPERAFLDPMSAAFPLLGKEGYLRACGAKGFREMQIIVPFVNWSRFAEGLERLVHNFRITTTLGSLKIFRGIGKYLCFHSDGLCIALDIPLQTGIDAFMAKVDELMLDCRGLPNVAKDSRLSATVAKSAFVGYDEFKRHLMDFDPRARFQSALRSRLNV